MALLFPYCGCVYLMVRKNLFDCELVLKFYMYAFYVFNKSTDGDNVAVWVDYFTHIFCIYSCLLKKGLVRHNVSYICVHLNLMHNYVL